MNYVLTCLDGPNESYGATDCTTGWQWVEFTEINSSFAVVGCPAPTRIARYPGCGGYDVEVRTAQSAMLDEEFYLYTCKVLNSLHGHKTDIYGAKYGCGIYPAPFTGEELGRIYMHEFDTELYDLVWQSFWEFFVIGLSIGITIAIVMKLKR